MSGIHFVEDRQCNGAAKNDRAQADPAAAQPSQVVDDENPPEPAQVALDMIEEASMESFPCSDPPGYTMRHS